jgi:hypothetical protein
MVFGMAGDMAMLRHCVGAPSDQSRAQLTAAQSPPGLVETMGAWHAFDQHATPSIAYMFTPGGLGQHLVGQGTAAAPFGELFEALFTLLTGRNPRRMPNAQPAATPATFVHDLDEGRRTFVTEAVQVQRDMWAQQRIDYDRVLAAAVASTGPTVSEKRLSYPDSWLAYAVSSSDNTAVPGTGTTKWLWALSPTDLSEIRVAHNLTRELKHDQSSNSVEQAERDAQDDNVAKVKQFVAAKLAAGVHVPAGRLPLHTAGATVKLVTKDDGQTYYTVNDVPWIEFRSSAVVSFPANDVLSVVSDPGALNRAVYVTPAVGLAADMSPYANALLVAAKGMQISSAGIQMAVARMRSFLETIEFSVPARNGGPARDKDLAPSKAQFDACQFLKLVATLSASIVRPNGPAVFSSPGPAAFVRRHLAKQLASAEAAFRLPENDMLAATAIGRQQLDLLVHTFENGPGKTPYFSKDLRPGQGPGLQDHQRLALEELMVRVVRHRVLQHFLRLSMGAGKTVVALLYYRLLSVLVGREDLCCLVVSTGDARGQVRWDAARRGFRVTEL